MDAQLPFRWNLARRQQLGSLLRGPEARSDPGLVDTLHECCVRVLAQSRDSDLIFVGRSPESLFDYLSGILSDSSYADRCVLLNVSMRYDSAEEVSRAFPEGMKALRAQLEHLGLSPARIATGERPRAFVDLVYRGSTFGHLAGLLAHWAAEAGVDVKAVRRRIGFIGITERTKNSPNTWRWYQRVPWAADFPRSALRSVSIDYWDWTYLGDEQQKVARWYPPTAWGAEELARPPRDAHHLEALRLAVRVHEAGRDPSERERFAAALAAQPEMRHPWLRRLVSELRGRAADRPAGRAR